MNYRWKLSVLSSRGLGDELSVEVSCVKLSTRGLGDELSVEVICVKYYGFRR